MANNILLTGATGLLGRHILYEWLKKSLDEGSEDIINVLIRRNSSDAKLRLEQLLRDSNRPFYMKRYDYKDYVERINVIEGTLESISSELLKNLDINSVIHSAGSTNLNLSRQAEEEVKVHNIAGTEHLLEQLPPSVNQFLYISTAYTYGLRSEIVSEKDEYGSQPEFRNYYEASKYKCETLVRDWAEKAKVNAQIIRPSIICGRVLEKPLYATSKFDVFYSWPLFIEKFKNLYNGSFRVFLRKNSGLNIIPVDIAAKCIMHCIYNQSITFLNLINPKKLSHNYYVGAVLDHFQIENYEYVYEKPKDFNSLESLYYRTLGQVFEKYITKPDLNFDSSLMEDVLRKLSIDCDFKVEENFIDLVKFSLQNNIPSKKLSIG